MSNGSAPGVVLVVLDGWGYRQEREGNAIELASTPNWQRLWHSYPRTLLDASGQPVINDIGLAALALLVAESDPAQKDTMIRLVMNMLAG